MIVVAIILFIIDVLAVLLYNDPQFLEGRQPQANLSTSALKSKTSSFGP